MTRFGNFAVAVTVLIVVVVVPWYRLLTERAVPARRYDTTMLDVAPSPIAVIGDSYTAGSAEGGQGAAGWTELAWRRLAQDGVPVAATVAAEGGAGYGVPGNRGGRFEDLTARAVRPDDTAVVYFGSRNDQPVDPGQLTAMVHDTLGLARRLAPAARLLVIGPAWPSAEVPDTVLRIRDLLAVEAQLADGEFVDPIADGWFVDRPELIGADGVHPTDAGHAYLAERIAPLIAALLPQPV